MASLPPPLLHIYRRRFFTSYPRHRTAALEAPGSLGKAARQWKISYARRWQCWPEPQCAFSSLPCSRSLASCSSWPFANQSQSCSTSLARRGEPARPPGVKWRDQRSSLRPELESGFVTLSWSGCGIDKQLPTLWYRQIPPSHSDIVATSLAKRPPHNPSFGCMAGLFLRRLRAGHLKKAGEDQPI